MKSQPIDYRFLPDDAEVPSRRRLAVVRGANGTLMAGALCPHCLRHPMTARHLQANAPCPLCSQRPRPI
jgi:hypothetical protein